MGNIDVFTEPELLKVRQMAFHAIDILRVMSKEVATESESV
jgi:hypothetical protein